MYRSQENKYIKYVERIEPKNIIEYTGTNISTYTPSTKRERLSELEALAKHPEHITL